MAFENGPIINYRGGEGEGFFFFNLPASNAFMIQVLISTAIEGRLKEAEGDFDISGRPMGPIILPLSETLDLTRILKYFKNICYLQVSTSDDGHVSRCVKVGIHH